MGHTVQGKQVGNIGFGLMGLTWRQQELPDEESFAVIKTALETGCNWMNGGEFYGPPNNNTLTLLKKYYEKYPEDQDRILLTIKGCVRLPSLEPDGSPENIKRSVENCVRMIGGSGRINQFEPARKDHNVEIEVIIAALAEQVKLGKIGGITLSEVSAATIRRAAKVAKIEAVEIELSIWDTEVLENGVAKACAELNIPILAYAPLGRGFLTGKIKSIDDIPEGDMKRLLPRFQPDIFETNLRLVKELEKLAVKKGCTPGQIAINWVLAVSRRTGMPKIIPIPGASAPERVRENAVEIELTEDDMAEIERISQELKPVGTRYPDYGMTHLDTSTE